MRFGPHLPQLGCSAGLDHIVRVACRAEDLGFDDVWVADHVAVPRSLPAMPSFFPEPVPMRRRGQRLDDYIGGWRAAWGGAEEYASEHFTFSGVRVKPAPAGPVPIWIGGSSSGALRRAAACEGWMGTWAPVEVFADRLAELRSYEHEAGADGSGVTASIHMEFRIGSQLDGAGRWSEVGDGYGERPVATGSVSELAELLARYMEVGLQHVLLVPLARSEAEWTAHVDAAAELKLLLGAGDRPGALDLGGRDPAGRGQELSHSSPRPARLDERGGVFGPQHRHRLRTLADGIGRRAAHRGRHRGEDALR